MSSNSLQFAFKAVVRAFWRDDSKTVMDHEAHITELMTASFQYPGEDEESFILADCDWPEEGYFTVWAVGRFVWTRDYFGEWDMDIEYDVLQINEARRGDMEVATGYMCYDKEQPSDLTADGLFTFTTGDCA